MAGVQIFPYYFYSGGFFIHRRMVEQGKFYYITDEYFDKFNGHGVLLNKAEDEFGKHGRPCFYCFKAEDFCWMIPISSKVEKYEKIFEEKKKRYPNYDGIRFGYVNGNKRAFLTQNICPVTEKYVDSEYMINHNTVSVTISSELGKELNGIARKIIRFYKKGTRIVLTDLDYIIGELNKE